MVDTYANRLKIYQRTASCVRDAMCSTGSGVRLRDPRNGRSGSSTRRRASSRSCARSEDPVWIKPDWAFIEEGYEPPKDGSATAIDDFSLGDYGLYMRDGYIIHGTIFKTLLGRRVTHGCIRLGDEDLEVRLQDGSGRCARLSFLVCSPPRRSPVRRTPRGAAPGRGRRPVLRAVEIEAELAKQPGLYLVLEPRAKKLGSRRAAWRSARCAVASSRCCASAALFGDSAAPRSKRRRVWTVREGPGDTDRETIAPDEPAPLHRGRRRGGAGARLRRREKKPGETEKPSSYRVALDNGWQLYLVNQPPRLDSCGASPRRCATAGCGSSAASRRIRRSSPWWCRPRTRGASTTSSAPACRSWSIRRAEPGIRRDGEWRRGWDSNPRTLAGQRFSRPPLSTAQPPLRDAAV